MTIQTWEEGGSIQTHNKQNATFINFKYLQFSNDLRKHEVKIKINYPMKPSIWSFNVTLTILTQFLFVVRSVFTPWVFSKALQRTRTLQNCRKGESKARVRQHNGFGIQLLATGRMLLVKLLATGSDQKSIVFIQITSLKI
jgi:hypothetical protein